MVHAPIAKGSVGELVFLDFSLDPTNIIDQEQFRIVTADSHAFTRCTDMSMADRPTAIRQPRRARTEALKALDQLKTSPGGA